MVMVAAAAVSRRDEEDEVDCVCRAVLKTQKFQCEIL